MHRRPASTMDVRKANRNRIYRFLHAHDGVSKPEIAQSLQMSLPTVLTNMKALVSAGLVRESGSLESTGGRKAVAMSIVQDARTAIGVDITRDRVVAANVLLDGTVTALRTEDLPFRPDDDYARAVGALVDGMIADNGIDRAVVMGVGISIPGILSPDGNVLKQSHVLDVRDYRFERLDAALGFPCSHMNDANAAAVGEAWGEDPDWRFVYVSLSNSVGGAIVWDGRPLDGDTERSGEIGHMTLFPDGDRCYCGRSGCVDAYLRATVLSSCTNGDLRRFFQMVDDGDTAVREVWERYQTHLATAVNSLRMVFDYDVVIGGYVGGFMDGRIDGLRRLAAERNTFDDGGDYIKVCRRKTEASAVGAALARVNDFIASV